MGTHPAVVVVLTVVDLVGMTRFERRLGRHGHVSPRAPRCGRKWRGDQRELCEKAADWSVAKLVGHFQSEMGIRSTTFLLGGRHR
jgi:hypothetical protein